MASRGYDKGLGDWLDNQDIIVTLMFDKRLGTARFQNVKHKASSNAFPYIDPHYSAFTLTGIGHAKNQPPASFISQSNNIS